MTIQYVQGDATNPQGTGVKIIVHIVNDLGAWGSGFVISVSNRWPEPEAAYIDSIHRGNLKLGNVQFVAVEADEPTESLLVANLVGQKGLKGPANPRPVQYSAVEEGLHKVALEAKKRGASVHMPRIGCARGGSKWSQMEPLIEKALKGISVTVYDL